nr:RNA-directed DNA polymerase, eukaryota, reverse transcriptase zinc-binding domain protein [Tanacetum cinerariifolium]
DPKSTASQSKINVPHPNKSFVAPVKNMGIENRSFASVLNVRNGISSKAIESTPAIVLDDDCHIKCDFSCSLMGEIKDLNAIPNLYLILSNEGFENVKISHLGGFWVILNMDSVDAKEKGDLTNVEDSESMSLSYKRLCVKIKANVTINDTIKVIVNVDNDLENNNDNLTNDFELDNKNEIDHVLDSSCMNENELVLNQVSESPENRSKFTPDVGKDNEKEVNSAKEVQLNYNGAASDVSEFKGVSSINLKGSLLDVMDELIKVGQAMGYNMDGCLKNIEAIIGSQRDHNDLNEKRMLREFLWHLINTWDGLVDFPIEGYSYTWAHKSGSKMNKLDKFLISEGLLTIFPSLSTLCLDRHLSDHRLILMRSRKIIDEDVVAAVSEFFSSGILPPGCNFLFIALIPKTQDAKVVKFFWPMSLIGCVYKIIAKILANCLSLVISSLISDIQSAFVSKCQILDGPFILNELLSWCIHKKSKAMIFKVDFKKAFDSARWDYLDDALNKFGFGVKWRKWIQGYISFSVGSILINGSPSTEFKFCKVVEAGFYKGFHIDDSLTLSHLFYADDVVFVGKWDKQNVITIVNVLKCFFLASGLKINLHKSKLMGIGIPQAENFFNGVTNSGRKLALIGWQKVLESKKDGGLGVSSFFAFNRALLFKWIWHFISQDTSLLFRVIQAMYGKNGALDSLQAILRATLVGWILFMNSNGSLLKVLIFFLLLKKVGNGEDSSFWEDCWLSEVPLKLTYPRLFSLELDKNISIPDKMRDTSLISSFRRVPRGGIKKDQVTRLRNCLNHVFFLKVWIVGFGTWSHRVNFREPWLEEEDERLTKYVGALGEKHWDALAIESCLKRSEKSCRLRWKNYLRPNLKLGEITHEEEHTIIDLQKQWVNNMNKKDDIFGTSSSETPKPNHMIAFGNCSPYESRISDWISSCYWPGDDHELKHNEGCMETYSCFCQLESSSSDESKTHSVGFLEPHLGHGL